MAGIIAIIFGRIAVVIQKFCLKFTIVSVKITRSFISRQLFVLSDKFTFITLVYVYVIY